MLHNIFIKNQKSTSRSMIYHNDLYGMRELKYQFLQSKSISDISWANVEVNSPYYLFVPNSISEANYYWEWININELFIKNTTGIVTMGDEFIVADTAESVESRIKDFLATNYSYLAGMNMNVAISDIKLTYIVKKYELEKKYKVLPTWVCREDTVIKTSKEGREEEKIRTKYLYIDAQTMTSFAN